MQLGSGKMVGVGVLIAWVAGLTIVEVTARPWVSSVLLGAAIGASLLVGLQVWRDIARVRRDIRGSASVQRTESAEVGRRAVEELTSMRARIEDLERSDRAFRESSQRLHTDFEWLQDAMIGLNRTLSLHRADEATSGPQEPARGFGPPDGALESLTLVGEPRPDPLAWFLNTLISQVGGRSYLQVGSRSGRTFALVEATQRTCVDPPYRSLCEALGPQVVLLDTYRSRVNLYEDLLGILRGSTGALIVVGRADAGPDAAPETGQDDGPAAEQSLFARFLADHHPGLQVRTVTDLPGEPLLVWLEDGAPLPPPSNGKAFLSYLEDQVFGRPSGDRINPRNRVEAIAEARDAAGLRDPRT